MNAESKTASLLIICPECHYGFPDRDTTATAFVCPRSECGHQWEALTATVRAVHGQERRRGQPELDVRAGAFPRRLELPEGETFIGRDAACQFAIDNRSVSRRHARLVRRGNEATIEDLGSACGTIVNGRFIDAMTALTACDEIVIGGTTLLYAVRFAAVSEKADVADSAALIASAARSAAPRFQGRETQVVPLPIGRLSIGRATDRDLILPAPMVSAKHALIERSERDCYISDVQSRIGTFVNGRSVIRTKLESGDRVQLGPFLFRFDGDRLVRILQPESFGLVADDVCKVVGTTTLLDHVHVKLEPGEFVGLLGPSGAGKTTLLDALNGLRPATSGRVLINDEPLYEHYDRLRHHIGYVPQDDIIHRELTVRQALTHAARLRLPADVSESELSRIVNDTMQTLQMSHRADVPIGQLSGGQRKRVSVGVELLSRPGILFLDEPTSGLDPGTEAHLMRLFRRLAEQKRTVVCTTHVMENVDLFHNLVVLAPGGRLAYFGPPSGLKPHFGIDRFTDLYDRMAERPAEEWQQRYRQSELGREMLGRPANEELPFEAPPRRLHHWRPRSVPVVRQWTALMRRNVDLLRSDRAGLALLVLQPLVITALICLVCSELPTILFLLVVSALWFGCSNAAQQIVKERAIYRRERTVNLRLDAYLLSKFVPLAVTGVLQCGLMLGMIAVLEDTLRAPAMVAAATVLTAWCGAAMGLIISALASNPDKAMSIVPLSLIPQIILAGVLVPLPDMNRPTQFLSYLVASRWANQACEVGFLQGAVINADLVSDPATTRPLVNLYPDAGLANFESRGRFLADRQDQTIDRARCWGIDIGILSVFTIVQLLAAAIVLRRQDVL